MGNFRVVVALVCATACGAADTRIDPSDLELRDLLGIAPEVARSWDAEQRAGARRALVAALQNDAPAMQVAIALEAGPTLDARIARTLIALDERRYEAGDDALGIVRIELAADATRDVARGELARGDLLVRAASSFIGLASRDEMRGDIANGDPARDASVDVVLAEWRAASASDLDILATVAADAGHRSGSVVVVASPRLPTVASYVTGAPARLLVNPVVVVVLDRDDGAKTGTIGGEPSDIAGADSTRAARMHERSLDVDARAREVAPIGSGNPYSFYGSVAECAYAQRQR